MELEKRFIEALKRPICDHCLGRTIGNLLSGMTNDQRGDVIRKYVAFMMDSGEKFELYMPNFHGIKFREIKIKTEKPEECSICKGFFENRVDELASTAAKKLKEYEFGSFLIGCVPTDKMRRLEEEMWDITGVDHVETIRSEINREVGKRVEKKVGKPFDPKNPDIVVIVDLKRNEVKMQVKSLFVAGGYKKMVRGIPQTKWTCMECGGKGCVSCGGEGKRYKTSVQEIIGKPLEKAADGKDNAFHGSGREDIDARCLDYRPFVLEVVKPKKRSIDLRKLEKQINRSKKVNVKGLKFSDKAFVRDIKSGSHDKTYSAEVDFESPIDKKLVKNLKILIGKTISQKTPNRVKHRRADIMRRRKVLAFSFKVLAKKKARITVKSTAGLYIKELIHGDEGRTKPSVAELLNNKVKRIVLDVTKIHKVK